MRPDPDVELVRLAAGGDRDAFGALVVRHQSRIVNLARALTADDGEAEDLAQETFVRAYKSIGRFRGDSAFGTWLYRVAINVIQSHLKSRTSRWRILGRSIEDVGPVAEATGSRAVGLPGFSQGASDPEEDAMRRQSIDMALRSLPADLRIAVTLRDVQGFEYAEIAEMLGVPLGTVESRIFRARQRLRPLLLPLVTPASAARGAKSGR